ncbi:MAG: hypothetical protein CL663_08510 [Bacteroidetes bacterium]|nr:hypothetical protein [Bacteroidota bacterium]
MPSKYVVTPIESGCYYHIFNRGVDKQNVFFCKEDYELFTIKMEYYLNPVCDILAFTLIPNHYHLLIKVNEDICPMEFLHQFKRFIICYTGIINNRLKRSGNLFTKPFRRVKVFNDEYLRNLILYIHLNPQNHEVISDYSIYEHSSFRLYLKSNSKSKYDWIIKEYFNDLENFIYCHSQKLDENKLKDLTIE